MGTRQECGDRVGGLIVGLVLSSTAALAQPGEMTFEQLSVEDGLSHSTVRAIAQDELGFLWFGTQDGLDRYDGYDFVAYRHDPEDPGSLAANEAHALLVDRDGVLWVATFGGGLDRFDRAGERFVHHRHDPSDPTSLSDDGVMSLYEDRGGTLWVGTEYGINRLHDDGTFTRYRVASEDKPRPTVVVLLEDRSGQLWGGSQQGLYLVDRESGGLVPHRHPDLPSSGWGAVEALLEDAQGRLWIGTREGLDRLDPATGTLTHYRHDPADPGSVSEDVVLSLHADPSGDLWVGTETGGLDRFHAATGIFTHARNDPFDPQSLSDNSILKIFEDSSGVLWLAGYTGINRYDRRRGRFVTYRQRPGREETLSAASVWALSEDREGVLWVGTFDAGLDRLDRQRRKVTNYAPDPQDPQSLPQGTVSALFEDREGVLWVGTWGGLCRHEGDGRFVTYHHDPADPDSLSEDTVYAIHEDREGRFWVGTWGGLNRMERPLGGTEGGGLQRAADGGAERFVRYPSAAGEPELLGQTPIYAILEDRSGAIWFASDRDGLFQLGAESGRFRHFRHDPARAAADSLPTDQIASLHEDDSGALWIGTYGFGLSRLDAARQHFRHFRRQDGLPSETVLGILEDDHGRLWLSTSFGLSRFDPATESFRNYDADDGLQGLAFSSRSAFRSSSGEMFFGGLRGLNAFFPDRIEDDPRPPVVVITDFRLFNRSVPLASADPASPLERSIVDTRELVLSHRDEVFSFEFAALHFAKPRKNRFAYRLEGVDRDWVHTDSSQRYAQYSSLDAGEYVFRVKASNGDGVWNEEGTSIRIVALPPPWKTWWAYTVYGLVALAGGAAYARSHRKKLARERAIAAHERAIAGDLRELAELKDTLLAERAVEIEERGRLIADLELKNVELARFNYTVSHDLKNPLVTIRNYAGLVKRAVAAGDLERLADDADQISMAADKLRQLLDELLEFSRLGHDSRPVQKVSLDDLAREAGERLAARLSARGVEVRIASDLPVVVGDRARLLDVFEHLLENAVTYLGEQPAPRIEIGSRQDGREDGSEVDVFYVKDNGTGIEARYHDRVFGLFERLDVETEGTGVGLALVKRIVEVHGGRIWVESEGRGRGSTFCFTLPYALTSGS